LKNNIAIIHFQPLEYYPPVQNIIRYLGRELPDKQILVYTTAPGRRGVAAFRPDSSHIRITTSGSIKTSQNRFMRLFQYLIFNTGVLFHLWLHRPGRVFYFETLSSFPAFIYKKIINRKADILIHYHEYTTPGEYRTGMLLERQFHSFENYLFPRASWLSHINDERMRRFLEDISPVKVKNPKILPNYPPESWRAEPGTGKQGACKRIVYAGALGLESMYIQAFAEWVEAQNGKAQWDIYSQQDGTELRTLLASMNSKNIHFLGMLSYDELPAILQTYDLGVILYKGVKPNHVHAASNKLFEYAACGLDVWFSKQMTGSYPYIKTDSYPRILPVDFSDLNNEITPDMLLHKDIPYEPSPYYCEKVLADLLPYLN